MVAITVILAAVIGAFVLGIGGDQESTPQASISLDITPNAGDGETSIEIAHNGGQTLELDEIGVSVGGSFEDSITPLSDAENADETLSSGETLEITAGDSGGEDDVSVDDDETVRLVHEPTGGVLASATA